MLTSLQTSFERVVSNGFCQGCQAIRFVSCRKGLRYKTSSFFTVTKSIAHYSRRTWSSPQTWNKSRLVFDRLSWLSHEISYSSYKGGSSIIISIVVRGYQIAHVVPFPALVLKFCYLAPRCRLNTIIYPLSFGSCVETYLSLLMFRS